MEKNKNKISEWRKNNNLSLVSAANILKVSRESLVRYEVGGKMSCRTARRVAEITGIPYSELRVRRKSGYDIEMFKKMEKENPLIFDHTTIENWWALLYIIDHLDNAKWKRILNS